MQGYLFSFPQAFRYHLNYFSFRSEAPLMMLLGTTSRQCFFFSEHCLLLVINKISRKKLNEKGIKRIKWIF